MKLPFVLQIKINQYILNNTVSYNSIDYPESCDIREIYTEKENKINSVFAVDHMKYEGLEKHYDIKLLEQISSHKRSGYIKNKHI